MHGKVARIVLLALRQKLRFDPVKVLR